MPLTAVFGGTFNPFHIGHYEMLSALNELDYIEKILVMPDNIPPHKKCDFLAGDQDRINMCRIACNDFLKAELCLIEFEREEKSYSYDSIMLLKKKYPLQKFTLVCGGDMITTLDTWYRFNDLKREISFLAFKRCGINDNEYNRKIDLLKNNGADIFVIDKKITDVSSTYIRNNIGGESIKKLLPEEIYKYIVARGIYNGKNTGL